MAANNTVGCGPAKELVNLLIVRVFSLTLLFALAVASTTTACPNCVKGLASPQGGANGDSGVAYNASILFMLAVPLSLVGFFGTAFWRLNRQASVAQRGILAQNRTNQTQSNGIPAPPANEPGA